MEWRPKRWLAALLSLLVPFLGLLYLQRPRLALVYLLASWVAQAASFGLTVVAGVVAGAVGVAAFYGVGVVAAIHSFRLAGAPAPTTERRWYSRWYGLIAAVLVNYGVLVAVRSFVFEPFRTPSDSMFPTLPSGSFVIVKKWGYGDYGSLGVRILRKEPTAEIKRGELILFRRSQSIDDVVYVKRVIGLPGDHVLCSRTGLVINGKAVPTTSEESRGHYQFKMETLDGISFSVAYLPSRPARDFELVVPEGHYFMLGDNRDNSRDSRHFGAIPSGNLVGRVEYAVRGSDYESVPQAALSKGE
jgi:signal peptidase I